MSEEPAGKRVSWVELYFDLIFVFAVGQMTHIMTDEPHWSGLGVALGLFISLWWTWVGFVILYNRHGEDRNSQRLLVLTGTLPCAVAAIEAHAAAGGHGMAFAFALAGARLVLAAGFSFTAGPGRRVAIGYAFSTAGFTVSAFVPSPWRFLLWAFLLIQEAGLLLLRYGERDDGERARRRGSGDDDQPDRERPARRSRTEAGGHLAPAFALLSMAAGVSLVLSGTAPAAAAWLITGGLASYLTSTRAVTVDPSVRFGWLGQLAVVAVTVSVAFLEPAISPTGVLLVTTVWAAAIAAYVAWRFPDRLKGVTADPVSYFHAAPGRQQRQPS